MENIQNLLNQVAAISKKNAVILDATGGRYNIFKVCGVNHNENIHSAIIAEFLNPAGSHGLKSKLLECFIKTMPCSDAIKQNFDFESASVDTEYHTQYGRIDIFIEDNKRHAIIIENKIYADDGDEQLKRYDNFAKTRYDKENYQIFYLSLWGNEATKKSAKGVAHTPISYCSHVIAWLEECVCIAENHLMVRETIKQYINLLKSLTSQDMDTKNKKEITEILCASEENVKSLFDIEDNITDVKNFLINQKFLPQLTSLCEGEKMKLINCTEGNRDWVRNSWVTFQIKNPKWTTACQIQFVFCKKELNDFIVGINNITDSVRNDIKIEKIKHHYPRPMGGDTITSLYKNFTKYRDWGKEAMIAICNGEMIEIFQNEIENILELTKDMDL